MSTADFNQLGLTLSRSTTRRDVMQAGLFSTASVLFSNTHAATAPAPQALPTAPFKTKAKSVIQVFLWGGMSHNDTWDPKPDAGYDYNGPMKAPLSTNVAEFSSAIVVLVENSAPLRGSPSARKFFSQVFALACAVMASTRIVLRPEKRFMDLPSIN